MRDTLCWNTDVDHSRYECSLCAALAAARRDGVERAAKAARGADLVDYGTCREFDAVSRQRDKCEAAIRALIQPIGVGGERPGAVTPGNGGLAPSSSSPAAPIAWDLWQHGETGRTVELPIGSPSPGRQYSLIGTMRTPAAPTTDDCPTCHGNKWTGPVMYPTCPPKFCKDPFHNTPPTGGKE